MAAPAGEDTRKFSPAGGRVRPGNPGCAPHRSRGLPAFKREETSVISICKTVVSGADPEQIRDQTAGLASAPLRDLAAKLAADPRLTVSVLTYRAFSFWLPTLPGAVAYLQLRRTVSNWRDERRAEKGSGSEPAPA